jgi:hypothetical protein
MLLHEDMHQSAAMNTHFETYLETLRKETAKQAIFN